MSDDRDIGLRGWIAGQKPKSTHADSRPKSITLEKNRVAVLPLANLTSDPSDEYFADGITEELISALANISGLRVISRTSTMQYKSTNKKASEIGRDLSAGSIIEGSVRKAGNQLRISVQLIDAQADEHLWAQVYDRELKDVFAVQSDIAENVSEALRVKLLPREGAQLRKSPTHRVEAYTFYLKGRHHWNKRTEEAIKRAIEYFELALGEDPNYALAYAGLADCYIVAVAYGWMRVKDGYTRGKKASLRALELDDNLTEAHASLAWAFYAEWNWTAAEAEYKRAIELNSSYPIARQWYSILLAVLDRRREALAEAQKASELDPLSPRVTCSVGERLLELDEYNLAVEQFEKALEIQPDFSWALMGLAYAHAKMSMCAEALDECQKIDFLTHSDLWSKMTFAFVYAHCGREGDARRILHDHAKNIDFGVAFLPWAAEVYSDLGDKVEAIELLQRGYGSHNPVLVALHWPRFDDLRSDPKLIELRKKMGLGK